MPKETAPCGWLRISTFCNPSGVLDDSKQETAHSGWLRISTFCNPGGVREDSKHQSAPCGWLRISAFRKPSGVLEDSKKETVPSGSRLIYAFSQLGSKNKRHRKLPCGAVVVSITVNLSAEADAAHSTHHRLRVDLLETRWNLEQVRVKISFIQLDGFCLNLNWLLRKTRQRHRTLDGHFHI